MLVCTLCSQKLLLCSKCGAQLCEKISLNNNHEECKIVGHYLQVDHILCVNCYDAQQIEKKRTI